MSRESVPQGIKDCGVIALRRVTLDQFEAGLVQVLDFMGGREQAPLPQSHALREGLLDALRALRPQPGIGGGVMSPVARIWCGLSRDVKSSK